MDAQQTHGDDVEQRDDFVLKSKDHHVVDIGDIGAGLHDRESSHSVVFGHRIVIQRRRFLKSLGLHNTPSEVGQMIDHEREDDDARPAHRAGSQRRLDRVLKAILGAARLLVFKRQYGRRPNVQHHGDNEHNARDPQERSELMEKLSVAVEVIRVLENLEVTHQMNDHEADQNQASEGHDYFPADRGAEEGANEVHRKELQGEWKRKAGESCSPIRSK